MKKIGEIAAILGISIDTLRYYEKIHLLNEVQRNTGGTRFYSDTDVARIHFIKQAQKMNFSLDEIKQLLQFREAPTNSKPRIRAMAEEKLAAIVAKIEGLSELRDQLQHLIEECQHSNGACPIIEQLNKDNP